MYSFTASDSVRRPIINAISMHWAICRLTRSVVIQHASTECDDI